MRRRLSILLADSAGASVIELALAFPLLMFLLLGAVDYAVAIAAKLKLEQAVNKVIEEALVVGAGSNDYDYLKQEVATASGLPLTSVTETKWLECDGVAQSSWNGSCSSTAIISRYISLSVTGTFTPPFDYGSFARRYGATGMSSMTITGSSRIRVQ
ncbi:MAG: pilus assembly protein [Novosphingobium sp.]|nr:pilus assembly protein [Novosphingobium sp.]